MDTAQKGQTRRIELAGEYDVSQKQELAALFEALPRDGPAIIDMTRVTFIDSSFLQELTKLRARLMPHRITLLVRSDNVRRILRVVKFDLLFEIQGA